MPSRSRERQLAKQYERRHAERERAMRRKRITAGIVGTIVGLAVIVIGIVIISGGDVGTPRASGAPTGSTGPSTTTSPSADGLPQRTGEVTPVVTPPATVACEAKAPAGATEPKPQFDAPPQPAKVLDEGATYTATMVTSCGTIELELYAKQTPQTVASFVFLAREGFFDGLTFHRIIPGFVIQGGDPLGSGSGGPGYAFADEIDPKIVFDQPGLLAMANSGPGTNGSQFFVTLGGAEATGHLDGLHTIFGEVTEGMDAVDAIAGVGDPSGPPSEAVYIESVTIHERKASPSASPSS
jgi:cyclophilin family peptidyl-prolyl cis-trans isomerase